MRSLQLALGFTYPTTATTTYSTPILLTGANAGSVYAGAEAVPGEDMGFPSSGNACVNIDLEGVNTNGASDMILIQVSNNYYADSGSGETFTTVASITPGSLTGSNRSYYLDRVPLGEAVRVGVTATGTGGAGKVTAYLLNN